MQFKSACVDEPANIQEWKNKIRTENESKTRDIQRKEIAIMHARISCIANNGGHLNDII